MSCQTSICHGVSVEVAVAAQDALAYLADPKMIGRWAVLTRCRRTSPNFTKAFHFSMEPKHGSGLTVIRSVSSSIIMSVMLSGSCRGFPPESFPDRIMAGMPIIVSLPWAPGAPWT